MPSWPRPSRSSLRGAILAVSLLSPWSGLLGQTPAALVSSFRGEVIALQGSEGTEVPIKIGLRLAEGDRLEITRGSRVVLLFSNGRLLTATSSLTIGAQGAAGGSEAFNRANRSLAQGETLDRPELLPGIQRPPPTGAFPLSPGAGTLVLSERPTFTWRPQEGAEGYLLQIRSLAGGPPVRISVPDEGPWTFPDTLGPLTRGGEYAWTVLPLPEGRLGTEQRFTVLGDEPRAALEGFLASLREAGMDPETDGLLLVAAYEADLGLFEAASRALQRLFQLPLGQERDSSVDLLHAHVLEHLGRLEEARAIYDRVRGGGG